MPDSAFERLFSAVVLECRENRLSPTFDKGLKVGSQILTFRSDKFYVKRRQPRAISRKADNSRAISSVVV